MSNQTVNKTISEVTRRAICDYLMASAVEWSGRLGDSAFLSRLYDLTELPSKDHRFANAAGDIAQHREYWSDWPNDWIFHDSRFRLLHCSDERFLRFLCETVHPVVRSETDECQSLVVEYNKHLRADGWTISEKTSISGRPVYGAARLSGGIRVFEEPTGWTKAERQLQEVVLRVAAAQTEEQYQAVGLLCREVLISVGEIVYDGTRHKSLDGVEPSKTDAKRRLEAFFDTELAGSANDEARAHARAAVRLADALQHKRTADFRTAALCAEASASVLNLAAIALGKRR